LLQIAVIPNIAVLAGHDEHALFTDFAQIDELVGEARMILEVVLQGIGLGQTHIHRTLGIIEPVEIFERSGAGQHLSRLILLGQYAFQPFADGVVTTAALARADDNGRIGSLRQTGGRAAMDKAMRI
jgi:hypothetical protein